MLADHDLAFVTPSPRTPFPKIDISGQWSPYAKIPELTLNSQPFMWLIILKVL